MQAQVCELISEIGEFEPAGIVSLGPVGVGKSSNLNTIASYLSNRLEQEAAAGSGASTLTVSCRSHVISYQGRPVKWKWMDTPGDLFTTLVEKWKRTELSEMNDGYVSQAEYEKHLDEAVLKQLQAQQIGCVMAMISAVELASQTSRTPGVDRLVVPPGSRLSCHLQASLYPYVTYTDVLQLLTWNCLLQAVVFIQMCACVCRILSGTSSALYIHKTPMFCVPSCNAPCIEVHVNVRWLAL